MQEILVIFMLHANILYMNTFQKFAKIPCLKLILVISPSYFVESIYMAYSLCWEP